MARKQNRPLGKCPATVLLLITFKMNNVCCHAEPWTVLFINDINWYWNTCISRGNSHLIRLPALMLDQAIEIIHRGLENEIWLYQLHFHHCLLLYNTVSLLFSLDISMPYPLSLPFLCISSPSTSLLSFYRYETMIKMKFSLLWSHATPNADPLISRPSLWNKRKLEIRGIEPRNYFGHIKGDVML